MIPGVGTKVEQRIWKQGILTWKDFMLDFQGMDLSGPMKQDGLSAIEEAEYNIKNFNPKYFMKRMPRAEYWRMFREFNKSVAYLDIETTGAMGYDAITVVGIYDGRTYKSFVKNENLIDLQDELLGYKMIVTYNGTNFDMPFIYEMFPVLKGRHIHIDVMYPLRRLGFRGGLKKIEENLGITRHPNVRGMSGWDAVRLWREYQNGKDRSLDILLRYNYEDCRNMVPLMETAYKRLKSLTFDLHAGKPRS